MMPSLDPDAQAFFAASAITGATQQAAINNLIKGLKTDGLWSKMKAVYPFVTDNRNLASYTEDFGNAYWTKANTTATLNATTAPNGSSTADLIIPSVLSAPHVIYTQPFIGGSQIVTNTIYAKAAGYNFIGLSDAATGQAVINLSNGTIVSQDSGITASTPVNVGNGWWRCTITFTATTNRGLGVDVWSDGSRTTFAGNGTSGVYLWGAQSELGATATTYQPIATTQQAYIASQFKYNLKDPRDLDAAFRLVFNGGWTHSSTGATPNGTNGYADTKLVPSSVLSQNSTHISSYIRNTSQGVLLGTDNLFRLWITPNFNGTQKYVEINSGATSSPTTPISTALGLWMGSRIINTQSKLYNNSSLNYTVVRDSVGLDNLSIFISARNTITPSNYSTSQTAFSSIGDGLLDAEAAALYSRVQNFQTSLNRAII